MIGLNNSICWNELKNSCVNVKQTPYDVTPILEKNSWM